MLRVEFNIHRKIYVTIGDTFFVLFHVANALIVLFLSPGFPRSCKPALELDARQVIGQCQLWFSAA